MIHGLVLIIIITFQSIETYNTDYIKIGIKNTCFFVIPHI